MGSVIPSQRGNGVQLFHVPEGNSSFTSWYNMDLSLGQAVKARNTRLRIVFTASMSVASVFHASRLGARNLVNRLQRLNILEVLRPSKSKDFFALAKRRLGFVL